MNKHNQNISDFILREQNMTVSCVACNNVERFSFNRHFAKMTRLCLAFIQCSATAYFLKVERVTWR